MMTLDEMKLVVCGKLPELIHVLHEGYDHIEIGGEHIEDKPRYKYFYNGKEINWLTEGLQVCHEAEKFLTNAEKMAYGEQMWQLTSGELLDYSGVYYQGDTPKIDYKELYPIINATHEQRLQALCRVWWPERFE